MSRVVRTFMSVLALFALHAARAVPVVAQSAVTLSGHVTAGGKPLLGARVRIAELALERATDDAGRYSLVIASSNVRGQIVHVVVSASDRRTRYATSSVEITLTGGTLVRDFDLKIVPERDSTPVAVAAASRTAPTATTSTLDTVNVTETIGSVDIASALAGRFPGLAVSTASVLGGSASLIYRGPRSVLGSNQPLFVIDGLPVDNTVFASSAARAGRGGFDYGSPLSDLNPADVASIKLLSPAEASAIYGSRGANGVVVISTKNGSEGGRFSIGARFQTSEASAVRLPDLQNQYGQGLNGKFEFFNGTGGGTNDAVDQNWGPALDGRAVAQASYTEAGRPDVRLWVPRPDNVSNYFNGGSTSILDASAQGFNDLGSFRASVGRQDSRGVTPQDRLNRWNGALHGVLHLGSRLELAADGLGTQSKHDDAAGTGVGESNPFFQFMRMGRQVDTDSLRAHLRDASGKQVSWIYTTHNNPYTLSLADSNYSHRYHLLSSGRATYTIAPWLSATIRGGVDSYRDGRLFALSSGWLGGFPFYADSGNFSKGGSEGDEIAAQTNTVAARIDGSRTLSGGARWTFGAGTDAARSSFRIQSLGVDSAADVPAAGAPDTARLPSRATWSAHSTQNSAFGQTGVSFPSGVSVNASLRNAWTAPVGGQTTSSLLPSISAAVDLRRAISGLSTTSALTNATVTASWWKDATNLDPYTIETMYAGRAVSGSISPLGSGLLVPDPSLAPEITSGWQIGGTTAFDFIHLGLGLTYYSDRTSGVILPVANAGLGTVLAQNAGEVSNQGVEGQASFRVGLGSTGLEWSVAMNAAKNTNSVDHLVLGTTSLDLGPSLFGLTVQAQQGQPLGVLVGYRTLRDSRTGALVLRNGLPVADSAAGFQRLGFAQPNWIFGIQNSLRYGPVTLSITADGRLGGDVFSATNLSGSYAGTLANTAFRPDTGLLIVGIDATTGTANTRHVSTQDYYHALGAIQEPWVYSASFYKLREARLSVVLPPIPSLPVSGITASLVGRNLYLWTRAPNIDPEAVFSPYQLPGVEMGQLPFARSLGLQVTVTP